MSGILFIAALVANFGSEIGPIRPELHSSGFGPTICSQTEKDLEELKSMGFAAARTHDWALVNANQRVCDYMHIFPLMNLDAKNPDNYYFAPTDYLLKRTREDMGVDIFFRLGPSIEPSGPEIHFNTVIPSDFNKVAETFAGTIRHYNRGWANGFKWDIKYWEIWNEPPNINNQWCPPEGIKGLSGEELQKKRQECLDKFVEFYVICLKRLKSEFGDTIKVGGPALNSFNLWWIHGVLKGCYEAGIAPDFLSWHGYACDPMQYNREAEEGRKLCDLYGFTKCELILNEWHYFGSHHSWHDDVSDPETRARIWDGPDSSVGIRSTCFTLAALANLQRSKMTQAYFYGCGKQGRWGYQDGQQRKYKLYYGLKLFGDIVRDYSTICESETDSNPYVLLPVKGDDGRKALLVVDHKGTWWRNIVVEVKGLAKDAKVAKCTLLDDRHNLTPHKATLADGRLSLEKPDYHAAAFFVEFE